MTLFMSYVYAISVIKHFMTNAYSCINIIQKVAKQSITHVFVVALSTDTVLNRLLVQNIT